MAKEFSIYSMPDSRCQKGKMFKADGPAVKKALSEGKITNNDTFDCSETQLLIKLKAKGL